MHIGNIYFWWTAGRLEDRRKRAIWPPAYTFFGVDWEVEGGVETSCWASLGLPSVTHLSIETKLAVVDAPEILWSLVVVYSLIFPFSSLSILQLLKTTNFAFPLIDWAPSPLSCAYSLRFSLTSSNSLVVSNFEIRTPASRAERVR